MKLSKLLLKFVLSAVLLGAPAVLFGHGLGTGGSGGDFMVTRHFTGTWDMIDHESQGLSLEVVEQLDGSRKAVVYWFTYGDDKKTAWFLGIGVLLEDRIEFTLFDSLGVGFMQAADAELNPVESIGTMTIIFDGCNSGVVTFETDHGEVGNGSFNIERISAVMNTHCTGGISDDMHSDAMFGEQRIELTPAREGITAGGHAWYEDFPGHMEFKVEVDGLPDGDYHLYVGMQDRGVINVLDGHGKLEFSSPGETGNTMMNFDPRGMQIQIHDDMGVVLSSFDRTFEQESHGHHGEGDGHHGGDDHVYDCEFGSGNGMGGGPGGGMGGGSGGGMMTCVDGGEFVEIEVDLENTAVIPEAKGEAEWDMNSNRVEFSVEIENLPVGSYLLKVGGDEVGIIEVFEMHYGETFGHIKFRDPESHAREHLDFEPRGKTIEVLQGDTVILEVEFPVE